MPLSAPAHLGCERLRERLLHDVRQVASDLVEAPGDAAPTAAQNGAGGTNHLVDVRPIDGLQRISVAVAKSRLQFAVPQ